MKRLRFVFPIILILVFAITVFSANVMAINTLLEDDFESYTVGQVPSPNWWASSYYESGRDNDHRVRLFDGNQVFALYSESWAAVASANIGPLLDYSIEADIYMMPRDSGDHGGAGFYLRTVNRNTYHLRGGYTIKFQPDSDTILILVKDAPDTIIGEVPYVFDFGTWYKVKASVTGDTYGQITVQVFVNDMTTPVLEVIDDGTHWHNYRGDVAGYTNLSGYRSGLIYYDNIKIYESGPPIESTIDIDPDTLSLESEGKWITCYIELPDGHDVHDIDIDTIILNETIPVEWGNIQGDVLMVKCSRSAVQEILSAGNQVEITVSGELTDGTLFEGTDIIRVK